MICAKMRVGGRVASGGNEHHTDRYAPEASRSQNNVAGNTNRIGTCRTPRREERGGHCHNFQNVIFLVLDFVAAARENSVK